MSERRRLGAGLAVLAAGTALAAGALLASASMPVPWVWAAAGACTALGAAAALARRPAMRAVWINLGAVVIALGVFEAYLWLQPDPPAPAERFEGTYTTDYFVDHDVLGYAPAPGRRATARKFVDGELVYDVVYTIDEHGLRATPQPRVASPHGSVLFFGGSVTFGEGVADEHAMPYQVAVRAGTRHRVHNFGFHGYGPHQMLAALERGVVDAVLDRPPSHVVYQAIPAHVARSAGLASWDRHGPRYALRPDGNVRLAGRFDDPRGRWHELLERSRAYASHFGRDRAVGERDVRLFLGVVRTARDVVAASHPGAEFHVILWGYEGDPVFDAIRAGVAGAGIATHLIADILPGYRESAQRYELSPLDRHPNPDAHALIAEYVALRIIGGADAAAEKR